MSILYKKFRKKFQDGGTMLSAVPEMYDPTRDGFLLMRQREEAADASKLRNAYANMIKGRKSNNGLGEYDPDYVEGKFFSKGPKGMRNAYQQVQNNLLKNINSKISQNPDYTKTQNYINDLNNLNQVQSEGEAILDEFEKYSDKIDKFDSEKLKKEVLIDGAIITLNNQTGKHEVISVLDYVDKIDEKFKADDGKEYSKYTPITVSMYKNLLDEGVHENPAAYKTLSEISSWSEVVDKYIDPITKKIKPTKIDLKSGDKTKGIDIDGLEISNTEIAEIAKGLGSLNKMKYSGNTKKLQEVTDGIITTILRDSSARDTVYKRVLEDPTNQTLLRKEKDPKKREKLFERLITNTIFNEVFLTEAVKYAGAQVGSKEDEIGGYYNKLKDEVKVDFNNVMDIYDSQGKHDLKADTFTLRDPNEKGSMLEVTYKYHSPFDFIADIKKEELELANDPDNKYGVSLYTSESLDKVADFGKAKIVGRFDPLEVYGKNNLTEFLQSSQIVDPMGITSTTMKLDENGVIDRGHYEFVNELSKAIEILSKGPKFNPKDPNSMQELRMEAINHVLQHSKNKDAQEYIKGIIGDVSDAKKGNLNALYKTFNGQRVLMFDVIGTTENEDDVSAVDLSDKNHKEVNLANNDIALIDERVEGTDASKFNAAYNKLISTNTQAKSEDSWYEGSAGADRNAMVTKLVVPVHESQLALSYANTGYGSVIDKMSKLIFEKDKVTLNSILDNLIMQAYNK